PIAWNVLPYAGSETDLGYTDEEWKLVNETRKILEAPDVAVEPTCVRVPVMVGHGITATAWFGRDVT
ncbi:MAG: aspartate-semialdehyde dehydrogenase, partial [Actinobacteria bacterium]|nr:aspartate-semialdehyde dehydrogenase [Actinomycetota bacterium]NIS37132.1 aspartate-semialdehyde dehydrogenase [Actinomycetota bacterium]NIT99099.1 aspartate-semialdehyde dehydrogenase [Actinomycetota bacterium]NIV59306.1 aspartate-semialdehyde dehydrogenase [Actinomycetota bacterium]NIV90922.1 aspartate-semialdehyde dehydrogenase [Actinomycetota bacterium]